MKEIYTVISRDNSSFIFTTTNKELAEEARKNQERNEEMGGGRPSVYIKTSYLIEK